MTVWNIKEPRGFSHQPFGRPSSITEDGEYKTQGFGDPKTLWHQEFGTLMGYDDVDTATLYTLASVGNFCGSAFIAPISGEIRSILAFVGTGGVNPSCRALIYGVSSGLPDTSGWVETSDEISGTFSAKWVKFTFSNPLTVVEGTSYYLCINNGAIAGTVDVYNNQTLTGTSFYKDATFHTETDRQYLIKTSVITDIEA